MRTSLKKGLALVLVMLMIGGLMAGCKPAEPTEAPQPDGPKSGGNLVIGLVGAPYSTANWLSNDMGTSLLMSAVNPRLMSIAENGKKELIILKEVTQSEDLKTVTWKIHEGLSWHDGVPFTVADIGFSFDYQVEYNLGHGATYFKNIESWKALDDYTIEIQLKEPQINFSEQAAFWPVVMPKHIYENVTDPATFEYNGLGFGPFKMVEMVQGEYYYCERVPNWPLANDGYGALLDSITFRVYEDANALTLALLNGEVDACGSYVNAAARSQIEANENFLLLSSPSLGFGYLGMNYKNEFLADNNVRRAIAMSVDREALVNTARSGAAIPMYNPVSPVYPDLVKSDIRFPALDVEGAKKVLEDAGYADTNGDGIREKGGKDLAFTLTCRSSTQDVDACASILKANMESIGIGVTVEILESSAYIEKVNKGLKQDLNFIEWGTVDDPDMSYDLYRSDSHLNYFSYKNETFDSLIDQMRSEPNYENRKVLLDDFQREFIKELPCIDLFVSTYSWGYSKKFTGWNVTPGYYGSIELKHLVNVTLAD